jgi:ribosomal protein S18 acetylase RimI-like enzyme
MINPSEIIALRKKEVLDLIHQPNFNQLSQVPIGYRRGLAQGNNPDASPADKILFLIYDKTILVGYLGVYPSPRPEWVPNSEPFGFLSCLWVNEQYRGRKIAGHLVSAAYTAYQGNLALTEATQEALLLYEKSGLFGKPQIISGRKFYIKGAFGKLILKKNPNSTVFSNLVKRTLDPLYSLLNTRILKSALSASMKELEERITLKFSFYADEILDYSLFESHHFPRNYFTWDWIVRHPWIVKDWKQEQKNYYFTSYKEDYCLFLCNVKAPDTSDILCQAIFLRIDGELKLKYIVKNQNSKIFREALLYLLHKLKVQSFISYDPSINQWLRRNPFPLSILSKEIKRTYLFSKKFDALDFDSKGFQGGDGDALFT